MALQVSTHPIYPGAWSVARECRADVLAGSTAAHRHANGPFNAAWQAFTRRLCVQGLIMLTAHDE